MSSSPNRNQRKNWMKVKITLVITSQNARYGIMDPNRVRVLLDDDFKPPGKYISTNNEEEVLKSICEKWLNYHYDWLIKDLIGFRKIDISESEVVYLTTVPAMEGCNKMGSFYSAKQIDETEIDSYYVQLISKFGAARR